MDTECSVRKRKDKRNVKEVSEPLGNFENFTRVAQEIGNGTSINSEDEPISSKKQSDKHENMNINAKATQPGIYLHIKIDVICIALLALALYTRVWNLEEPRHIVFDELHYGRYVTLYTKGVFFFDAHPPLGKQLLYLAGSLASYDGNFTFDKIGAPYTENVPIRALRLVPAITGSLLVSVTYLLMQELSVYNWTAILASLLVLFENSLLAQSRFMLLESIQLLFGLSGILFTIRSTRTSGFISVLQLFLSAVLLGCCFSVKYSGLYTYYLAVFLVGRQVWGLVGTRVSWARLAWGAAWRAGVLLWVPSAVYLLSLGAHVALLGRAGPHDGAMSSAFQASLQGGLASVTRGQPLHVAHGSQITLRHSHGRTCWLHSHAHVYPLRYADGRGSSHQQQVTCYSFKDVNNWWIVKRPERSSLGVERPPDVIRHGDVVQLLHGITSRALHSHDVAAPVSPQAQEVSCYIDYNVSMPAQNLWRVEIVNRESDDATWDSIHSRVRLIHSSGAALRYSGRQLPAWGFHQHEVVADRALAIDSEWNVEEHRYTKAEDRRERERELLSAEMIPTSPTAMSFWAKLCELQYKMLAHAPDAPLGHMFASEPADWPLLARSIAYWMSPDSNAQIHLIGNLITWYSGSISVVVFASLLCGYALSSRRAQIIIPASRPESTAQNTDPPADQTVARTNVPVIPPAPMLRFYDAAFVLFLGYWLHYLPYFFVDRTLFLHHYLPAYIFKILLLSFTIEHVFCILQMREKTRSLINIFILSVVVWLAYVVITFKKFSVLNYGNTDLTENDLMNLRWKDTWDFILHKRG